MTFKKSMISIAAAGVIAAGLTGCGSDDSTTPVNNTTVTGMQSATQAIDGYIYNAKAEAFYLSEDNTTMKKVTLTANPTTKDIVSGDVVVGDNTYSLPTDTKDSVRNAIKFFKISSNGSETNGTTFTPASYIESDNVDGYDVNDTQLGTTVIYAPANSKITSPLTSLIVSANPAVFGTETAIPTGSKADFNSTILAAIDSNASKLAENLGLGDIDLLTADPVQLATTNPTFRLVTALLKDAGKTQADAILAVKTPATDLASTLKVLADNLTGTAKTLATSLQASAANGAFTVDNIAEMNIEKSVVDGEKVDLKPLSITGKFPITEIMVDTNATSALIGKGDKIGTNMVKIDMDALDSDKNVSTASFKFVASITGNKGSMEASDSNNSGSLVIELPFDLNATGTSLASKVSDGAIVKYEAKASNGQSIVSKTDINASTLSVDGTNVISTDDDMLKVNVASLITNVLSNSADANLTNATTGLTTLGIASVEYYLVDVDGKVVGTDDEGENNIPLAKGSFSSSTGAISVVNGIKVLNNGVVDMRSGAVTGANVAPDSKLYVSAIDDKNASTSVTVQNNTSYDVNITADTTSSNEQNATVVFTKGAYITDNNLSNVAKTFKLGTTTTTSDAVDFNISSADLKKLGDINTTIKYVVTDEFDKATTNVMNFTINRAPVLADDNKSAIDYDKESFTYDFNITDHSADGNVDLNTSYQDVNISNGTALIGAKLTFSDDTNYSVKVDFNDTLPVDANISFQSTVSQ